jgi:preprotein translocase subunit SecB
MADEKSSNGKSGEPQSIEAQVIGQYIKDLSFENPNVGKQMIEQGETPNLTVEVNVNARRMGTDVYESATILNASAESKAGAIYVLEIVYAGLFRLQNVPPQALEPFLLINCPALVFPFLRRLAADITREGGFPPLLLDPIDFAGLYMRRQQEASQVAGKQ